MQLDDVVMRKLSTPGTPLSPEESRACLVSCIRHGKSAARRAEGKRIVVVLGNTGAGKSSLVNMLHGCAFEYEDDDMMVVREDSPVAELMRIGHTNNSETFSPQVEDAAASLGAGFAYADCPGFLDNRGFEINVANAVNVRHTVAAAESAVVVVLVNYYSLRADRGKGLHDLLSILIGLFGTVERVRAHAPSVMLGITQAPTMHPETGAVMSLERYRTTLLNPAGADGPTAQVLSALSNVFIFHLLERGDASWMRRDALLERLRGMPPIAEPSTLFQAVLGASDKERLRGLVAALGHQVRSCLSAGSASGYAEAARLTSELLELRLVEHGFVVWLIEAEVRAAVEERMAAVVTVVDSLFLDGHLEGDDEAGESRRLTEAREALRSVHDMLTAFSGIEPVHDILQRLVAEAAAKLEGAESRRVLLHAK